MKMRMTDCVPDSFGYTENVPSENSKLNKSIYNKITLPFKSLTFRHKKHSVPSSKSQDVPSHNTVRNKLRRSLDKSVIERISKFLNLPDEYEKDKDEDVIRKSHSLHHPNNYPDKNYAPDNVAENQPLCFTTIDNTFTPCKSYDRQYPASEFALLETSPDSLVADATGIVGSISPTVEEVTWSIDDFFTVSASPGNRIMSPTFTFAGYRWRMVMWPNGDIHIPGSLDLWLQRKEPRASNLQTFNWTLGLRRSDGTVHSSASGVGNLCEMQSSWQPLCRGSFFSQTKLLMQKNMVAPQGCLTTFCRLSVGAETEVPEQKEGSGIDVTLCNNLKDLFISGEDCDVAIDVQGKKYGAHRAILKARTPVLCAMFSHDMVENNSGALSVVDCDSSAFREFLLFVYSGKMENLCNENVTNVYYIADKYDLPVLKEECVRYMRTALSSNSICDVICLATRHAERKLLEEATHYFAENVEEILQTVMWQRFLQENSAQANELLIKSFKTTYVKRQ